MNNFITKIVSLKKIICTILVLFSLVFIIQCSDPVRPRGEDWSEDLDYFARELPERHYNLFFKISSQEFYDKVDELRAQVSSWDDYKIIVGLMKIVALVGDAHTTIYPTTTGLFQMVPLQLYWFTDGLYVIAASSEYQTILGERVTGIGSYTIDDVNDLLETVISHENEAQLKNMGPNYMMSPEILSALGIINDINSILIEFEDAGELSFTPQPYGSPLNWITILDDKQGSLPLYLQRTNFNYWFTLVEDSSVMYAQYNRCREMSSQSFDSFTDEVLGYIDSQQIDKFIFDMRLNGGGSSVIAQPLINGIKERNQINQTSHLFIVIGRKTFSSAILNSLTFKNQTNALFVGEATGGKPNHYGEVKNFSLPNSGVIVNYSTKYFQYLVDDPPSLYPDITTELSFNEYKNCVDPVMDAILDIE